MRSSVTVPAHSRSRQRCSSEARVDWRLSIGPPVARETPLTPRQRRLLELALVPDDPDEGWLTAKRAARQTKVERVTASRDLARLEELGVIERDPGLGGRSTRYRVRLGDERPLLLIKEMSWPGGP